MAQQAYQQVKTVIKIKKIKKSPKPLLSGNEAIGSGALKAGIEAYVGYPMTPATGILNYMASIASENDLVVFQPENEIAVINMAIGLSFSGKKTMIGTSGGGFGLMNEGISLAGQSETPLIVAEVQRMGPSTGVPTYGGQSDLLHVLSSGHGDFTRFIVAPGDAEEAFFLTGKAVNIAWKYQIPAIVLSDKEVSESTYSFDEKVIDSVSIEKPLLWKKGKNYLRYENVANGISALAFPGNPNAIVKATSYEHDEKGIAVEDEKSIKKMQDKRLRKYAFLKKEIDKMKCLNVYGNKKSRKVVIVWGSVKGVAREVGEKLKIKVIQLMVFQPFPEKELKKNLQGVDEVIVVEVNSTGQMAEVLKKYGISVSKKILKYTGRPFTVEELERKIKTKI